LGGRRKATVGHKKGGERLPLGVKGETGTRQKNLGSPVNVQKSLGGGEGKTTSGEGNILNKKSGGGGALQPVQKKGGKRTWWGAWRSVQKKR